MTEGEIRDMTRDVLRDKLLVAIRCTTLARSVDVARMLPHVFVDGTRRYVRYLDKQGRNRLVTVSGRTLALLLSYLLLLCDLPQLFLFRHSTDPGKCLGSEWLAKLVLIVMDGLGIDIHQYKSHSIRGASATLMLREGASPDLTRQRGGWATPQSFEKHYNRLHQTIDWESILVRSLECARLQRPNDKDDERPLGELLE